MKSFRLAKNYSLETNACNGRETFCGASVLELTFSACCLLSLEHFLCNGRKLFLCSKKRLHKGIARIVYVRYIKEQEVFNVSNVLEKCDCRAVQGSVFRLDSSSAKECIE